MTPPPVRIALTGGSGFIGRRFADEARASGYRIRHLSRRPVAGHADDEAGELDLSRGRVDPAILGDCDIVVHLAAHIPGDHRDSDEAARCWQVNAHGTLRLAEAAADAGVRRFVHTSSANAYAAWEGEPAETAAMFPRSRGYYLGSKILGEVYAAEVCRRDALSLAVLRLGSVYGPGQTTGAVAMMASKIAAGIAVALTDGGRFGADFVHVDDVVAALMLVVARHGEGAFNVGSGTRTTIAEVSQRLVALAGADPALLVAGQEREEPDDGFPALSIARIRALGYAPRDLGSGLSTMVDLRPRSRPDRSQGALSSPSM